MANFIVEFPLKTEKYQIVAIGKQLLLTMAEYMMLLMETKILVWSFQ